MSMMSRRKGKAGELELANLLHDLTGWDVRRRVRQHDGDSDLTGIPGWSAESKRHATATRGEIGAWWAQTVTQATPALPVLFYRANRGEWRAVWPLSVLLGVPSACTWVGVGLEWTAETSLAGWAAVAREVAAVDRQAA